MLFYTSSREGYTQCILYIHTRSSMAKKKDIIPQKGDFTDVYIL